MTAGFARRIGRRSHAASEVDMTEIIQLQRHGGNAKANWAPTPTAEAIHNLMRQCQFGPDIGLIIGAPGAGKTTALQRYVSEADHRVWLCSMSPSASALVLGMLRVCEVLEEYPVKTGAADVRDAIMRRIDRSTSFREYGCLLVFDEAQHMSDQLLEEIRCIHDATGAGIVLCGNASFPSRFKGKMGVAMFAQLTSRIGARIELKEPTAEDIAAICGAHGIEGQRAIGFLKRQTGQGGGLRIAVKIIRLAGGVAGDGVAIRLQHLQAAAVMLGVSL